MRLPNSAIALAALSFTTIGACAHQVIAAEDALAPMLITDVHDVASLRRALNRAPAGSEIMLTAGTYDVADLKLRKDVVLIGDPRMPGGIIFTSSAPTQKGILNPLPDVSLSVQNLVFKGATSPDQNGAGIRHDGRDLTILDSQFIDNDNGVLSTGDASGKIKIDASVFEANGFGDGYSHGIYVVRAKSVVITSSSFKATKAGHHVKSLAQATHITDTKFDDRGGSTSYAVDTSNGGDVVIARNHIVKSPSADNSTIFNYDISRGGDAGALTISDNVIVNSNPNGRLLRHDGSITPRVENNTITNERRGRLKTAH